VSARKQHSRGNEVTPTELQIPPHGASIDRQPLPGLAGVSGRSQPQATLY